MTRRNPLIIGVDTGRAPSYTTVVVKGKKVIDDFFAWFGHDQNSMDTAEWDELARRIDLAIMKAVEENR